MPHSQPDLKDSSLSPTTRTHLETLQSFAELPDNWNSYGGSAFDEENVEVGRAVLLALDGTVGVRRMCPGPSGELSLSFDHNGFDVSLLADYDDLHWLARPCEGSESRHFVTEHKKRGIRAAILEGLERIA